MTPRESDGLSGSLRSPDGFEWPELADRTAPFVKTLPFLQLQISKESKIRLENIDIITRQNINPISSSRTNIQSCKQFIESSKNINAHMFMRLHAHF